MLEGFSSKAILTKAHAMYGHRLTEKNYKDLLQKHSVAEVAAYLKAETAYNKTLAGTQDSLIHRGQLEDLLRRDMMVKYRRLVRYDSSPDSGFYKFYRMLIEVEQLLTCMRLLNTDSLESYIDSIPGYMVDYLSYDMLRLAKCRSFEDVLAAMSHTKYKAVLEKCAPRAGEGIDFARCERMLRQFYYDEIFALIDKHYSGKQREELRKIFLMQITLNNISTIYRLKRFFNYDAGDIRSELLHSGDKAVARHISLLAEARDSNELLSELNKWKFGVSYGDDFESIEHANGQTRLKANKRHFSFTTYPAVAFTAYMFISQIEIANIVSIIEGKRYGVPESEIEQIIIM